MDREVLKTVGKQIARYRKMKNLKQSDLGDLLGVNQAVISGWEIGRYDPGSDNIILLSKALGVTPNEILGFFPENIKQIEMPDESMSPVISQKDVLTVDVAEESPPDGSIVVADTKDCSGIIRKLFRHGTQFMLLAIDPSVPPICAHNVNIKGKVTDIHRKL